MATTTAQLHPSGLFLRGYLKKSVYHNKLHTLEKLEENIAKEISNIDSATLSYISENMKCHIDTCLAKDSSHFQCMMWYPHVEY